MRTLALGLIAWIALTATAAAQFEKAGERKMLTGDDVTLQKIEVGFKLDVAGLAQGIVATFPVPTDWPEQTVRLVEKRLVNVKESDITFDMLGETKQASVLIRALSPHEDAEAILVYEVARRGVTKPSEPEKMTAPPLRDLDRNMRVYLSPGPAIESNHSKITKLAAELTPPGGNDWDKLSAFYDYIHQNVQYENGPLKGAVAALEEGRGDCEEMTALFVALSRAAKIPARTVWVPGHCYPEVYLKPAVGDPRWVIAEMTNQFPIGESPETRPILQKGDNFRVQGSRRPEHYVKPTMSIKNYESSTPPVVQWFPPPGVEPNGAAN
ncbi:transglutaminase-like domain-containing protein [Blastopirellula sp. JC732]|uniref:Transglutaminase-like domain-containing protein n=1 Tax=Blastopirellula sediminis TaxID=2894196 RepID=A0A9X1MLV5_9BACT|nr:transglutaminase-like domain-containing protein [Blastopirellula sediminis]MCC9609334.1 transglutaminase-like domain-containing protein [Blastopirellula sediminis]MCC9627889.1 transglutaminase-like domain-containing protein [Blastopirellula sediminis]